MTNNQDVKGWPLLHSPLPRKALSPLDKSIYGVEGLTDVNEGYLIQRLFASQIFDGWRVTSIAFLGHEDRTSQAGKQYRVYLASVAGELIIEGKSFGGAGASDNRRLDAAFKGANTVAFKSACKVAGLTAELYLDGRAIDHIYESREKIAATREEPQGARTVPADIPPSPDSGAPPLALANTAITPAAGPHLIDGQVTRTPQEIAAEARRHIRPPAAYDDTTAVCPSCGKAEFLGPKGAFCASAKGGCGWPKGGTKGVPISYGEFRERQAGS